MADGGAGEVGRGETEGRVVSPSEVVGMPAVPPVALGWVVVVMSGVVVAPPSITKTRGGITSILGSAGPKQSGSSALVG